MKKIYVALMLSVTAVAHAADSAEQIFACMRANVPQTVRVQDIQLVTTDRSGSSRSLRGRLYSQREPDSKSVDGLVRVVLRISAPTNLAGASYLVREASQYLEQGMYVYLPAVRRVRRISGELADGSLMGTDFSYNDFRMLQLAFGDQRPSMEGVEKIDDRDTQVMSFKPSVKQSQGYSQVRAWVDQKTCVPLKLEYYQGQSLRKQMTAAVKGLKQSGSHWYAAQMVMTDLLAGSRSELKILKLLSDEKLPSRIFDPQLFYVGG